MGTLLRKIGISALFIFVAGAFALFNTGCESTDKDSPVPWGRPADWEDDGPVPGM